MIANEQNFIINFANTLRLPRKVLPVLAILTLAVITLSLWPDNWMSYFSSTRYEFDKIGHFSAYLVLSALTVSFATGPNAIWIAALLWLGIGTGLEGLQYFLPHRWPSYYDLAANFGGVLVGTSIGWLIASRTLRRNAHHPDKLKAEDRTVEKLDLDQKI